MIGAGILIFLASCMFARFHSKQMRQIRNQIYSASSFKENIYEQASNWLDYVLVNNYRILSTPLSIQIWGVVGLLLIVLGMFIPVEVVVKYHELTVTFH